MYDDMLAAVMGQCAYLCLVIGHYNLRHQSTSAQAASSACSSDHPATIGTPRRRHKSERYQERMFCLVEDIETQSLPHSDKQFNFQV